MSRALRLALAGLLGAMLGWVIAEPWTPFGHLRDYLMLFCVSYGITFALIVQKFFYAKTTMATRFIWIKEVVCRAPLYITLLIGVLVVKLLFYAPEPNSPASGEDSGYNRHAGQHGGSGILTDKYGNPEGSEYDLAPDGTYDGQLIAVLQLYYAEGFDFSLPRGALEEKGFQIHLWQGPPTPVALAEKLGEANQLWVIASNLQLLNNEHLKVIETFFKKGGGLYIWGDNEPYYQDANVLAQTLFGITMNGDTYGDQVIGLQQGQQGPGLGSHLVTTGIEYLYEGITIATVQANDNLEPLVVGSAGNLIAAAYDQVGRRAIIDGGFTRLFLKWDTAGTGRYVKNAASWLASGKAEVVGTADGIAEGGKEAGDPFPWWKRLLGWGICGMLIGFATGIGNERREMMVIGSVGGFLGGLLSAVLFIVLTSSGPYGRMISFSLLGTCIGLTIFFVEALYAKLVSG